MTIENDSTLIEEHEEHVVANEATPNSDWVETFKAMSTTAVVLGAT